MVSPAAREGMVLLMAANGLIDERGVLGMLGRFRDAYPPPHVVAHELGHALGLGHVEREGVLMHNPAGDRLDERRERRSGECVCERG